MFIGLFLVVRATHPSFLRLEGKKQKKSAGPPSQATAFGRDGDYARPRQFRDVGLRHLVSGTMLADSTLGRIPSPESP